MHLNWPQWLIIIAIFGKTGSKTVTASSPLFFPNSLQNQVHAIESSPSYIRIMPVEYESPPLVRSQSV